MTSPHDAWMGLMRICWCIVLACCSLPARVGAQGEGTKLIVIGRWNDQAERLGEALRAGNYREARRVAENLQADMVMRLGPGRDGAVSLASVLALRPPSGCQRLFGTFESVV